MPCCFHIQLRVVFGRLKWRSTDKSKPELITEWLVYAFPYVIEFSKQANAHNLTNDDFPYNVDLFRPSPEDAQHRSAYRFNNPFTGADYVCNLVDMFVMRFEQMKLGDKFCGDLPWQQLPLQMRYALNDLIVDIKEAKDAGLWRAHSGNQQRLEEIKKGNENKNH